MNFSVHILIILLIIWILKPNSSIIYLIIINYFNIKLINGKSHNIKKNRIKSRSENNFTGWELIISINE